MINNAARSVPAPVVLSARRLLRFQYGANPADSSNRTTRSERGFSLLVTWKLQGPGLTVRLATELSLTSPRSDGPGLRVALPANHTTGPTTIDKPAYLRMHPTRTG